VHVCRALVRHIMLHARPLSLPHEQPTPLLPEATVPLLQVTSLC